MGSANIKAVRERIKSVNGTMHITRAMQLVASSKIKRAQAALVEGRSFFGMLQEAFGHLAGSGADSPFLHPRTEGRTLIVVIAGDRGLAGGYNNNIFKALGALCAEESEPLLLPVGRKAVDFCRNRGWATCGAIPNVEHMTQADCQTVADEIVARFTSGECRRAVCLYTHFRNLLTQEVTQKVLLPATPPPREQGAPRSEMEYEPSPDAVLNAVVPLYLTGMLWGTVREAYASEIAARQTAMDNATKNAGEMIDSLTLRYNRARQSAITGEITEIVAGAAAET